MTNVPTGERSQTIAVNRDVLADARRRAAEWRAHFARRGTLVVHLVSSPGSGKTSLLEATARHWNGSQSMAVLVGDLATDRDARRLQPLVPVQQLTTGGACHLELSLIERGLQRLPAENFQFLFIENVGNLVCPAAHDLGEHLRVALLSSTEGDDKPAKYPKMFRTSHALVISKTDLLPHVPFSIEAAAADARQINPALAVLTVCSLRGEGIERWCQYLEDERRQLLAQGFADPALQGDAERVR